MTSRDITPEQAETMQKVIRPALAYVGRMRERMIQQGFPQDDLLFHDTERAHDALQSVFVRLHYLTCRTGVGR